MNRGFEVGDFVEFRSDRQTEKGPSAGRIIEIGPRGHVCIRHSDHPGEWFDAKTLLVEMFVPEPAGVDGPLWLLV